MSGTPEWLDDKGKIIEHRYCQCFLEQHPLLSKGEDFFTTEGVVTDKDRLLRDVFDDIKEHLTGGLVTKAKNLLEAIRMECYDRGEQNGQLAVVCGHFIGCLLVDSTILPSSNYR